jgi:NADPH:quinone reductase-like Zn-dependent oxidoreductase
VTALQLIRDVVHARPGVTVLIQGAAGGVGSFATQIAKNFGAKVIGTASGGDIDYLKTLNVDKIIDYKNEKFEEAAGEVDAVVDLVGGETLARSYQIVKKGGVLVTTVQPIDDSAAKRAGIQGVHFVMQRKAADLKELAALVEKGAVIPRMAQSLPLSDARRALELSESGRTRGKVILNVAA